MAFKIKQTNEKKKKTKKARKTEQTFSYIYNREQSFSINKKMSEWLL